VGLQVLKLAMEYRFGYARAGDAVIINILDVEGNVIARNPARLAAL
jgi:hypothetical protein